MKRSLRKAVAFLMAVTMVAGAFNVPAYAAENNQATSGSVTTLAEAIYDDAVTFSDSVAFLQNGRWSNENGENVTKDTTIVFVDAEGNKSEFKNQDAQGNQIFDAIYPMISDGYYNFDAFKIIKDGKISYIRTEAGHPYYGETLQWYAQALPLNDEYMLVSQDLELTSLINADGEAVIEDVAELYWADAIGNCIYVKVGNAVWVIHDGEVKRTYDQFDDIEYNYDNLGNGYGFVTGGEYNVILDKDGNIVEAFQQVGNAEGTGSISVEYVNVDTIESGYVVRRILETIYGSDDNYDYNYYYDVYNMETGDVVAESTWYPELDGNTIVGYNEDQSAYVASVNGTTYIENLDEYVYEELVTDAYEEATYSFYYVNGSLLISLTDWADMVEAETYILTQETGFADASKKHADGTVQSISYNDEYVLTTDADGYIDTMLTTKGDKVKEYENTEYQYGYAISKYYWDETEYYSGEVEGFAFITYHMNYDDDYAQDTQAYILEDGSIYEYTYVEETSGNFLLAYEENEAGETVTYVINTDNEVVYSGVCYLVDVFWNADYFAVTEEDTRCYLYDRDGNIVLGEDQNYVSIGYNFRSGFYQAHDDDIYGKYEYFDECRPNGICVVLVETEDAYKYGAISLAEKTDAKNGLHQDPATGKWYYYVDGVVDTTYDGVADVNGYTWYVENGQVDFSKNGLLQRGDDWYYFKGGRVDTAFTGLTNSNYGWWYVEKGKITFNYTGLVQYGGNWWYVKNSNLNFKYDGVADYGNATWYVENSKVDFSKNGLLQRGDDWYYFKGGKVNTGFTGLTNSNYGWWYVEKGKITFNYTGLVQYGGSWWYVKNSNLNFKYDGVASYNNALWYVENSKVDFSKTGLYQRGSAWYLFKNGQVNAKYNGLTNSSVGWWYIENGTVTFKYTGLTQYGGSWWYVKNSNLNFKYDGVATYGGKLWYVENSKVDFSKKGLQLRGGTWYLFKNGAVNPIDSVEYYGGSWWYVDDGVVDFKYNGLGSNAGGTWYIKNGKVDFSYTGTYEFEGETYNVVNGKATLAE